MVFHPLTRARQASPQQHVMAYLLGKLEERNILDRETTVNYLHKWDTAQDVFATVVRVGFIPVSIVFAAWHSGVPMWAIVSPIG